MTTNVLSWTIFVSIAKLCQNISCILLWLSIFKLYFPPVPQNQNNRNIYIKFLEQQQKKKQEQKKQQQTQKQPEDYIQGLIALETEIKDKLSVLGLMPPSSLSEVLKPLSVYN